jgi:energy-converting hydrogenase Eha subunit E
VGGRNHAPARSDPINRKKQIMLYTIAVVLIILWLLGLVTGTTIGGFVHILLVIAVIMVLVNLISGRKPLA